MADNETEVIIVGGGPVGLSLACDLSNRGVKTIVLERSKTTAVIAKAFALNSRSMEHFRRMGVQEKIQNASLPRDITINIGFYSAVLGGVVEIKKTFSSWGDIADGNRENGYPFYEEGASPVIPMFCAQCSSEPVLKHHIETTSDCVKLLFGHQAVAISQDENGVVVEASVVEENETKIFKGQYLVACDGGSSPSRKLLGAHLYGKFEVARAVSVMFNSPQMYEQIKNECRVGLSLILSSRSFALTYVVNDKGDIVTHIVMPPNASDDEQMEYERNPELTVRTIMGSNLPLTIIASSSYKMHGLLSTKSRVGRVLFAGDSAHQWLPAGGLGLNTGISDVGDLGWKLEAAVKGYGGVSILDSYEEERRPLVDMTRRYALSLGENILSNPRLFAVFSLPVVRSVFRHVIMRYVLPGLFETNLLTLGFQYSNSSIIIHEYDNHGEIVTPLTYNGRRYPALPGCRAPHVALRDHESTLDLFGKCFVLLDIGGKDTDLSDLKEEFTKKNVPLQQICLQKSSELIAAYDRRYFLVRPDGLICWRSDFQPSSLESANIVATVIGESARQRLPLPVTRLPVPLSGRSILPPLVSDLVLRFGVEMVLSNISQVPRIVSCLLGFGVLFLRRALGVKPLPQFIQGTSRHSAVTIQKFGDAESVLKVDTQHTGSFGPRDVLVRVYAASVNPIDCQMRMGYGSPILTKLLSASHRNLFPLVLGRDCAGEVVAVGDAVTKFLPGDCVFAAVPIHKQGTHAQLVSIEEDFVSMKPSNVDFNEAASLPWVACSAWSALVKNAGLNKYNCRGKKILILAGLEGVGSFAVQMLKAWGAEVTVLCSTQSVALARHLGADNVIDYTIAEFSSKFNKLDIYDVILDSGNIDYKSGMPKLHCSGNYVQLVSPNVLLSQKFGVFVGCLLFSWMYRYKVIVNRLFFGRSFYYTTLEPDGECLHFVSKMVEKGEIRPMIEAVYSMDEIIAAYKHVEAGSRGKIVVTIT